MSLPVSQYEALLAQVRGLRQQAQHVQELVDPLLEGTLRYEDVTDPQTKMENENGIPTPIEHLVNSEPTSRVKTCSSIQNSLSAEQTLWNSGPAVVEVGHILPHHRQNEVSSVISFSSSAGATLDRLPMTPDKSVRPSQQLEAKMDMVYSLLAMLGRQEHADMEDTLLALSTNPESCHAMRQSGCIPLLVQLVQSDRDAETRQKALKALHNLINSQNDDKIRKREIRILKLLEIISAHNESLITNMESPNEIPSEGESNGDADHDDDDHPVQTLAHLMKLSFDEGHRHAICHLGGIHTIAKLVEIEHSAHDWTTDKASCILIKRYACMALTNLTFGDGGNKALLCSYRNFIKALVIQLRSPSNELRQVTASVLRNLSWRADSSSKEILKDEGTVKVLMETAMHDNKENTLKSILSALWNLSAHCTENKYEICAINGALAFLVKMLTYKSSSDSLAIVENSGGILRNISSQIAIREDYRETLRNHNCMQILLDQLRSPSLTIVSNACGTLWNLSAKNSTDQEILWQLGAPSMLRSLNHSKHKMIAMGSSAALKNLLSAKPDQPLPQHLDSTALSMDLPVLPTLGMRKQKALLKDLDPTLSETFDNLDHPLPEQKSSRTKNSLQEPTFYYAKQSPTSENLSVPTCNLAVAERMSHNSEHLSWSTEKTSRKSSLNRFYNDNGPISTSNIKSDNSACSSSKISEKSSTRDGFKSSAGIAIEQDEINNDKHYSRVFPHSDEKEQCSTEDTSDSEIPVKKHEVEKDMKVHIKMEITNKEIDMMEKFKNDIHSFEEVSSNRLSKIMNEEDMSNSEKKSLTKKNTGIPMPKSPHKHSLSKHVKTKVFDYKDCHSPSENKIIASEEIDKKIILNQHTSNGDLKVDEVKDVVENPDHIRVYNLPNSKNVHLEEKLIFHNENRKSINSIEKHFDEKVDTPQEITIENQKCEMYLSNTEKYSKENIHAEHEIQVDRNPIVDLSAEQQKSYQSPENNCMVFTDKDGERLERSCNDSPNVVDTRMLDPDAMIESLDRFTAELVSQASSHLQNKDSSYSANNNTWLEQSDITFPSSSSDIPNVISFNNTNSDSVNASKIDESKLPEDHCPNDLSLFKVNDVTESSIITMEANRIADALRESADSFYNTPFDLDHIQPPSHLNSLSNSITGLDSKPNSPKFMRKISLPSNIMAKRALSHSSSHNLNVENVELKLSGDGNLNNIGCEAFNRSNNFVTNDSLKRGLKNMSPEPRTSSSLFHHVPLNTCEPYIENINPPSILDELTDMCNSLADIPSSAICSETDVYEDCFTHPVDTECEITEFSDANSITPVQSDTNISDSEFSPKRSINSRNSPPGRSKRSHKERYKTFTITAESLIETELYKPKIEDDGQTRIQEDHKEHGIESFNIDNQGKVSLKSSPSKTISSVRKNFIEKRQLNRDRFKTQTLDQSTLPLVLAGCIDSDLLESETNKPLMNMKIHHDDLLDCETLSLVSNEDESENNSESSIKYRTYHKSWSFRHDIPVIIPNDSKDKDDSSDNVSPSRVEEIKTKKPIIVKPSERDDEDFDDREIDLPKGIRGRRKPLYAKNNLNRVVPKPSTSYTASSKKNVISSPKPLVNERKILAKPPLKLSTNSSSTKEKNVERSIPSVSRTPKSSIIRMNSDFKLTRPKSLERQGTFTKDESSSTSLQPKSKTKIPQVTSKIPNTTGKTGGSTSKIPSRSTNIPSLGMFKSVNPDRTARDSRSRIYARSASADSKESTSSRGLQSSISSQSLKHETLKEQQNGAIRKTLQENSSNTTPTTKKQVTSRIASIWKKIEETKKTVPQRNDTKKWIAAKVVDDPNVE